MFISKFHIMPSRHKDIFIPLILILSAFLGGLVCGTLALHALHASQLEELRQYLTGFLQAVDPRLESPRTPGLYELFQVLKPQVAILGIIWLLGLTVVGIPLIVLVIGARGFIIGFTVGYLIKEQALRGLLLAMVAVLPQNICYVPAFIGAGSIAFYFSLSLLQGSREGPVLFNVFVYSLLFVLVLLLILLGTWIEACFVPGLIRLVVSMS